MLKKGDPFTFTIKRGVGTDTSVSVNYDDFVNDVERGDTLLIDGNSSSMCLDLVPHVNFWCNFSFGRSLSLVFWNPIGVATWRVERMV